MSTGASGTFQEPAEVGDLTPDLAPGTTLTASKHVDQDQPWRYGEASGDMNPIHTDREFAKSVGFDDVILQGLCTMTFVHQALGEWVGGDPQAVERLRVRFQSPVYPGDDLEIGGEVVEVAEGTATIEVEVTNPQGEVVLDGRGEIAIRPVQG